MVKNLLTTSSPLSLNPAHQDHQTGARDLLRKYGEVVQIWRSAVSVAYSLDFVTAIDYLKMLEGEINALAIHATAVTNLVRC